MATPTKTTDVVRFLSPHGTAVRWGLGTASTSEIVASVVLPRTTNTFVKVTETTAQTKPSWSSFAPLYVFAFADLFTSVVVMMTVSAAVPSGPFSTAHAVVAVLYILSTSTCL